MRIKIFLICIFFLLVQTVQAKDDIMILQLKGGDVVIELFSEIAPNHVNRFKKLAVEKKYGVGVYLREI